MTSKNWWNLTSGRVTIALAALLIVGFVAIVVATSTYFSDRLRGTTASISAPLQDPNQAENYRRLAAAKRKAAERVPERKACYEEWARYYDCLADQIEAGDNRECPALPTC